MGLTDAILLEARNSRDAALSRAAALVKRIESRDVYAFCAEVGGFLFASCWLRYGVALWGCVLVAFWLRFWEGVESLCRRVVVTVLFGHQPFVIFCPTARPPRSRCPRSGPSTGRR